MVFTEVQGDVVFEIVEIKDIWILDI